MISAPTNVPTHAGLADVFNGFLAVLDWVAQINKDAVVIGNPNASDSDRANAYLDYANIKNEADHFSGQAQSIVQDFDTKFQTYLESVTLTVPSPANDTGNIPLQYNGHNATLWDLVNALTNQTLSQSFSVSVHLNDAQGSINWGINWLNPNDLDDKIGNSENSVGEVSYSGTGDAGNINYSVCSVGCEECQGADFSASASLKTWLNYALASNSASSESDLQALNDLIYTIGR